MGVQIGIGRSDVAGRIAVLYIYGSIAAKAADQACDQLSRLHVNFCIGICNRCSQGRTNQAASVAGTGNDTILRRRTHCTMIDNGIIGITGQTAHIRTSIDFLNLDG